MRPDKMRVPTYALTRQSIA